MKSEEQIKAEIERVVAVMEKAKEANMQMMYSSLSESVCSLQWVLED